MRSGPIEIVGDIYVIERGDEETAPDYLGGQRIGRLSEVLSWSIESMLDIRKKGGVSHGLARITGDSIEVDLALTDYNEELVSLISNKRSSAETFAPGRWGRKVGHLLRPEDTHAIVIRDSQTPLEFPALYIPYAICLGSGWMAARGAKHTELMEIVLTSLALSPGPPFEYGDITAFEGYEPEVGP